jgi:hypothetical protein
MLGANVSALAIACASIIASKMHQYKLMQVFTVRFKIPMLILHAISGDEKRKQLTAH